MQMLSPQGLGNLLSLIVPIPVMVSIWIIGILELLAIFFGVQPFKKPKKLVNKRLKALVFFVLLNFLANIAGIVYLGSGLS